MKTLPVLAIAFLLIGVSAGAAQATSTQKVTFTETGMPVGTTWVVIVATGTPTLSTAIAPANITFGEPPGNYTAHVGGANGTKAKSCPDYDVNFTVGNGPVTVAVVFDYNSTSGCSSLGTPPVVGAPGTNWGEIAVVIVAVGLLLGAVVMGMKRNPQDEKKVVKAIKGVRQR